LLAVARQAHADGAAIDPAHALPLYLRDKVALTVDEREAARRASSSPPRP
jgi:tRNA threonylcarbamoyladenosine biosynthesis protein TsaB